jgi:hypothetical protein
MEDFMARRFGEAEGIRHLEDGAMRRGWLWTAESRWLLRRGVKLAVEVKDRLP